jgi:phosphoglycolate phosphatase-like HAD superfamily hydrolase
MIGPDTIDAIFFDLDGTLVDTDNAAVDRLAARLRWASWLFPARDPGSFARWLVMHGETPGNHILTLLDALRLDGPLTALSDRLPRRRHRPPPEFRPIEGVADALANLARCYRLALVTNRSRRHIGEFRDRQPAIAASLDAFIGRQDTMRFKPHPAPLNLAARRLEAPIERCLMVGDTTVDVRAARRAGARSAAVLCGFGTRDELERAGADLVLDSVAGLVEILAC